MPSKVKQRGATKVRRRTRKYPLGEETRAALIEKAEAMFADKGIAGVSIRQIGVAIGSSNSNVIGYHFGTKDALVQAILLRNRPQIEARRAELLDQAKRAGSEYDILTLLEALCRPIFERKNADGLHTYARFLWHISRCNGWVRPTYVAAFPTTEEILRRLAVALPKLSNQYFMERMRAVADIVTGVLQRLDSNQADNRTGELMFAHALEMANAVLTVPIGKQSNNGQRKGDVSITTIRDSVFGA